MDYGPQSICVANSNTNDANCVAHQCVQIQGTQLTAFSLTINGNKKVVILKLLFNSSSRAWLNTIAGIVICFATCFKGSKF